MVDVQNSQIVHGKWHGDVVIHTFNIGNDDKKSQETFYDKVKSLMHIRHENIVSFMGASIFGENDIKNYIIVTNPVKAESLFAKTASLPNMFVATKMNIACQVSSCYAVDIIRIKSFSTYVTAGQKRQ